MGHALNICDRKTHTVHIRGRSRHGTTVHKIYDALLPLEERPRAAHQHEADRKGSSGKNLATRPCITHAIRV